MPAPCWPSTSTGRLAHKCRRAPAGCQQPASISDFWTVRRSWAKRSMSAAEPPARARVSTASSCVPSKAQRALLLPAGIDLPAVAAAAAGAAEGAGDGAAEGAGALTGGAAGAATAAGAAGTTAGLAGAGGAGGAAGAGAADLAGAAGGATGAAAGLGAGVAGVTMTAPDFISCFCSTLLSHGRSWYTLPQRYSACACNPVRASAAQTMARVVSFIGNPGPLSCAADANATRPARTAG